MITELARRETQAEDQRARAREARRAGVKAPKIAIVSKHAHEPSAIVPEAQPVEKKGVSLNLEGFSFGKKKLLAKK